MSKEHKSVVRNQGYTRGAVGHIERHNERKNENYSNRDVVSEQSSNNIYYKICDGTYLGAFDKMVKDGEISTRGLKLNNEGTKPESNIIAEMIFDVNTEYFEEFYESHGYSSSYEFAKNFYYDAYKMAVDEAGDEKYILSAVMHADERNKGLSEKLGRDVYHYHLHVVYIPVVEKEIKWTKKCKDKSLIGTIKEVINQVNHSKKWECEKAVGEDGKERLVYSYSKLQDRYHDHMKVAGYDGFERGKFGSTAEHLSVLDYKTKIRQEELAEKENQLAATEKEIADTEKAFEQKSDDLTTVDKQIAQKENHVEKLANKEKNIQGRIKSIGDSGQLLTLKQIEKIQTRIHAPLVGKPGIILSEEDEKSLRKMAITAATANEQATMNKNMAQAAYEAIRDIIQAVSYLKYDFKGDMQLKDNLTPEQETLITTIRSYAKEFVKRFGFDKLADDMRFAKLDTSIAEKFYNLEQESLNKNKPSINDIFAEAKQKAKEHNEQNKNAPAKQQGRKSHDVQH